MADEQDELSETPVPRDAAAGGDAPDDGAPGGDAPDDGATDDGATDDGAPDDGATVSAAEAVRGGTAAADDPARMDLPKWNRSRVKRKAPKGEERDAFQQGVRQAGRGAVRKAPILLGALVLAAGGLALGIYLLGQRASTKADATKLLATAAAYEARGIVSEPDPERVTSRAESTPTAETQEALDAKVSEALGELAATAPDSPSHRVSRLLQAGRAMRAADFSGAEAAYRTYLDADGDASLNFLAREGMVLAIEAQGRYDDALVELEPLLEGDARGFFRDQALWHKGRISEAKGDAVAAVAAYHEYVEHFPLAESSFARDKVVERLTALDPDFVPPPKPESAGMPGMPGFPMPMQ